MGLLKNMTMYGIAKNTRKIAENTTPPPAANLVREYRGKKLEDHTKAELIDIIIELGQLLEQEHDQKLDEIAKMLKGKK